jgi:6,7-dimethyl-8-ribityllumazine synthase
MATHLKNLSDYNPEEIPNAEDKIFGIVVSEWNTQVTGALLDGCLEALGKSGAKQENILIHYVPGTYELAFGAQKLFLKHHPHAVICLGCVIQGETRHFDFICQAAATGIMQVSINHNVPVIFGVLTTDNLEQAMDRAGGKHGNKGFEAGITALKTMN